MLRIQFPNMHGLYDVTLGNTLSFPSEEEPFVQILNASQCQCICVSNIGCKPNSVKVYDSLLTQEIVASVQESIAVLLSSSSKTIYVLYPDAQQQSDSSSCGLYALAFAYMLCEGKNFTYDERSLRSHYLKCIKQMKIEPFSCNNALYHPQKPIKVANLRYIVSVVFLTLEMKWYNVQHVKSGSITLVLNLSQEQK